MIRLISILPSIEIVCIWYDYTILYKIKYCSTHTYLVVKWVISIEFSCSLQSTYLINLDYQGFSGKITVINSFLVIKEIFTL